MIYDPFIIGCGFTGLSAGMALAKKGKKVLILEKENCPGGLASTFNFKDGSEVEKFYHHWFNNDTYVNKVVSLLNIEKKVVKRPSKTGMYFNNRVWKLSSPLDLLRFSPLKFLDRIRLGSLVLRVRIIKDWKDIEHLSIEEWLKPLCGEKVFNIIWKPLIDLKILYFCKGYFCSLDVEKIGFKRRI